MREFRSHFSSQHNAQAVSHTHLQWKLTLVPWQPGARQLLLMCSGATESCLHGGSDIFHAVLCVLPAVILVRDYISNDALCPSLPEIRALPPLSLHVLLAPACNRISQHPQWPTKAARCRGVMSRVSLAATSICSGSALPCFEPYLISCSNTAALADCTARCTLVWPLAVFALMFAPA